MARYAAGEINQVLGYGRSVLLLGPRQAGKSTVIREMVAEKYPLELVLLQDPSVRIRLEQDPGQLIRELEAKTEKKTVFIDEVQKVPEILDSVQYLIDEKKYRFILTGSSARKLRRRGVNLLPGRIIACRMDPLLWGELGLVRENRLKAAPAANLGEEYGYGLPELMVYGALPVMVNAGREERRKLLRSYVTAYLEEEIRAEALVLRLGVFSSFLRLVAQDSGGAVNLTKLSQQTGVSLPTIREYFEILKDTLVLEELPVFSRKVRRQIAGRSKYYLFDTGVRNALIGAPLAEELINVQKGVLFEHAVVLEIMRRCRLRPERFTKLYYWRTRSGLEVDLVIETAAGLIPVEIKAAADVALKELPGLTAFMDEYQVKQGWVITLSGRPQKLTANITALPWNCL